MATSMAKRSLQRALQLNFAHDQTLATLNRRKQDLPGEVYAETFRSYIARVCPRFPFTPHTERLINLAQRVADGILRRLFVELPPRHWKSTIFSRLLPGYYLRRYPDRSVGIGAHTANLAQGFSEAARGYFVAAGGILAPSSKGVKEWGVSGHIGGVWTAGVGGGTGQPGHLVIVDDPIKSREMAESAAWRRQVHSWWDSVLSTREEPENAVVIVHTRWHTADLIGYLLSKNEELEKEGLEAECEPWHVVSLPIEAPPANDIKPLPRSVTREADHRQPGEALDPTRFNERWIRRKKANTPDRDWEAIYQQRPSAGAGTVFLRDLFRFYRLESHPPVAGQDDLVLPRAFARVILSVDCSFKDSAGSDMVAMGLWGINGQGAWKLDQVNQRMGFTDTVGTIKALHKVTGFTELLIEEKANGSAVIDTLKADAAGFMVTAVDPEGGKVARANAATVCFKQGRVFFPRQAVWLNEYLKQLLDFPAATFDDMVDETTQLLNYIAGTGPMRVSTAIYGRAASNPEAPAFPPLPDAAWAAERQRQSGFRSIVRSR